MTDFNLQSSLAEAGPKLTLGERSARGEARRESLPIEIAFLAEYGEPPGLLEAAATAARCGVTADQALLGEGYMREFKYYRWLALHLGASYYNSALEISPDVNIANAMAKGIAPLSPNAQGFRYLFAPLSAAVAKLLAAGYLPTSFALVSPQEFGALLRFRMGGEIAANAAGALQRMDPTLSAHIRVSYGQWIFAALLALCGAAVYLLHSGAFWAVVLTATWTIFACSIGLRAAAVASCRPAPAPAPIDDHDLPVYSIIAPLACEAEVVPDLIEALDSIDYPRPKLDIKIVIEEDDLETLEALARLQLPSRYHVIVAPAGAPRTKPRALNVALEQVRGELLVIYDVEDRPAPDQLRRAAARFREDGGVDCLQARLVIDNAKDSWLVKLFAMEYAALFDVINPGLTAIGAPIALGGSSNHFRTAVVRRIGGWDAWNVTEDADLGLRLARNGCRVAALDSDTYEEAPSTLKRWFNQRRRWLKGWVQTQLVHSREPLRLIRELGAGRALAAQTLIAGGVLGSLFGPPLLSFALWRLVTGDLFVAQTSFKALDNMMALLLMIAGCHAILIPMLLALHARGWQPLYRYLPLLPVYYALISVAALMALIDLAFWPFHWSKTQHGLARSSTHAANLGREWRILR